MGTKVKTSNLSQDALSEIDRRVTGLIDSSYVNLRVSTVDSAQVQGIIDSDYITTMTRGINITTQALYENSNTISSNYTIGTGNNAMSAGPITINDGVLVTVPAGSRWTVV